MIASAQNDKGKPYKIDRAAVIIVQLYCSAIPVDSSEYGEVRSGIIPCLSNSVSMVVLKYSPRLSVQNLVITT